MPNNSYNSERRHSQVNFPKKVEPNCWLAFMPTSVKESKAILMKQQSKPWMLNSKQQKFLPNSKRNPLLSLRAKQHRSAKLFPTKKRNQNLMEK